MPQNGILGEITNCSCFFSVILATLIDLTLAANYLDVGRLYDVTCKTISNMLKGKSADEIRKQFVIENDFTAEQKEEIRKQNEWCEAK